MKISTKKMIVLLAIIFSLVTVSSTWAKDCDITVAGSITEIVSNGAITVDDSAGEITVYGIPMNYLDNQFDIVLSENDVVAIEAIVCKNTGLLEACTLWLNDAKIELPGNRGLFVNP